MIHYFSSFEDKFRPVDTYVEKLTQKFGKVYTMYDGVDWIIYIEEGGQMAVLGSSYLLYDAWRNAASNPVCNIH